jgi:hypothetical protein
MSGRYETWMKLRAYLTRGRVNGEFNEPQQAAWDALNEVEDLVRLLKLIRRHGMTPDREFEMDSVIKRNSREQIKKETEY